MLQLLLDEQISHKVAAQIKQRDSAISILSITHWHNGRYRGISDYDLLVLAYQQKLTLVTYDLATFTPLLKDWTEQAKNHCGVIFIDQKTIPQNDIGGLTKSLIQLYKAQSNQDWQNRIVYLSRSKI